MRKTTLLKKNLNGIIKSVIWSLALVLTFNLSSYGLIVGNFQKVQGRVSVIKKGTFRGISYKKVKGIEVGDVVRTKRRSFADILFIDKSRVLLKESSRLIVEKFIPKKDVSLKSPYGKVIYKIAKAPKGTYKIKTPTALIGVKGTVLATIVTEDFSMIIVKEGTVEVVNPEFPKNKVILKSNMATVVKPHKPPT